MSDPNRMMLSQDLALLSFTYDASPSRFEIQFSDFCRKFRKEAKKAGVNAEVRHGYDDSNRHQYFVVFFDGTQFDYFDFSSPMTREECLND